MRNTVHVITQVEILIIQLKSKFSNMMYVKVLFTLHWIYVDICLPYTLWHLSPS